MACLYSLLAKPFHNLALRVLQRYYHELCQALISCPEEVAAVLYSNALLTMEERSQVVDVQVQIPFKKAQVLVQAVERKIIAENSAAPLRKFCRVVQRRHGVGSIVSRMKFRLAYVEQHHQLPDDDWSSDTDCEQKPPSPVEGPAKPVGNLTLRVFQRYFAELCTVLSREPHQMAREMFSKELITKETMRVVVEMRDSFLDKAGVLVEAIQDRVAVEGNSRVLTALCELLKGRPDVDRIAARMKARLAYVEQHHQLPNDDWSSDTECEQRVSSPADEHLPPTENLSRKMKRHSCYLKKLYKEREGMCLKWPPVLMKDFVNVLCIESTNEPDDKVTEQLVRGNVAKVKRTRMPIELSDIGSTKDGSRPKCILVQGAPGSGKTMFSWELCRRWGQGELLGQYPLVVMLPLRDLEIQNASSLKDLFPHDDKPFKQEVIAAVKQEAGEGVLFVLDGFDELPAEKRSKSSFWMKLITGKILRLATVMVTSRPWAIKNLLELKFSTRISQHIEIVGFTSKNVSEYISKAFVDCTKERNFYEYLARYPLIRSTMYVPLNCAIVVEVYRLSGSTNPAPKTMTQLYTALVETLLQRYMDSHPDGPTMDITPCPSGTVLTVRRVDFLKDLPSKVYHQLRILSRLAYEGLCNNQQLIFSNLPANFETLGLLQEVPQFYPTGKVCASYNFPHLTVQEFLAALHIVEQGTGEQEKVLSGQVVFKGPTMEEDEELLGESDSDSDSDTDSNFGEDDESWYEEMESGSSFVRMFVAGLSGLKQCKLLVPEYCREEEIAFLHILFESQDENIITRMLGNDSIVRTVSGYVSPHDAYVLVFCISLSRCQWKLKLFYIGDEHVNMFDQAIDSWGCGQGRITSVALFYVELTNDGMSRLLSLPNHMFNRLLDLSICASKLDSKCCEMLANCLSCLPNLEILDLARNLISCEGAQLLSQSLYNNTTLRFLNLSWNKIENRGGCSLAEAMSINKGLEVLYLWDNPLGEESIKHLIDSLQHNHTLQDMGLPQIWEAFSKDCDGWNEVKSRVFFI